MYFSFTLFQSLIYFTLNPLSGIFDGNLPDFLDF